MRKCEKCPSGLLETSQSLYAQALSCLELSWLSVVNYDLEDEGAMRDGKVEAHTKEFACDGVQDDSAALAALFRRSLAREGVRRSRKSDRAPTEVYGIPQYKVL
jgi:hypothetical protein